MMPSNNLMLCLPPLLLPSIFPVIRVFCNESVLHIRRPKCWSSSSSISPSNEYSGLISFSLTGLISLISKGLSRVFFRTTEFFGVQPFFFFYHPALTSIYDYWKTIVLTIWTFVGKVMSLVFNTVSKFVIAFLPRSKFLLISWCSHHPQHFGAQENKVCHCFHCFPVYLPWSVGIGFRDPPFLNIEF